MMWRTYLRPPTLAEALDLLDAHAGQNGQARLIAGGTDVLVELSRGVRPTETLIDLTAIPNLRYVNTDGDQITLGALTTHNDILASVDCHERALPLAQACWEVGAPQIRTRATVAGNLITASPANDTITPLIALGASVTLASHAGERTVPLDSFYQGVRRTVMAPNELLREIRVPMLRENQRGIFLKLGLRRAQAISVINAACVLALDGDTVTDARIALGSVAPTIIRATVAEEYLRGKRLDDETRAEAGRLAAAAAKPIDDVRGTALYRNQTLGGLVAEALRRIATKTEAEGLPDAPVLLDTDPANAAKAHDPFTGTIETTINGAPMTWANASHKTLLNALREDGGLTGTKEGCAEGECGACTVWLDSAAVMSCLVPAAQAHGARLITIEGLADTSHSDLHPLQRAFIEHGASQCGYCIPGMLMAGAKLLDERPHPDLAAAQIALSGNICRCTGYRKILDAVLSAGGQP
jgi:carbon-monoxide dehydrogenase medium subunit